MIALRQKYLLADAILPFLIKVGKVCRAEILPLEVLCMPLLPVLPHFLNLLRGMFANARIITVGANDDVLPCIATARVASTSTAKFRPRMIPAAAEARPSTSAAR